MPAAAVLQSAVTPERARYAYSGSSLTRTILRPRFGCMARRRNPSGLSETVPKTLAPALARFLILRLEPSGRTVGSSMPQRLSRLSFPLIGLLAACSSARHPYDTYPDVHTSDYAVAGVLTGTAAVIYATAGGCTISECPADTVCNPATERCERIECGGPLAKPTACPSGTQCENRTGTCVPF
jgi:hypothetical protein